MLKMNFSSQDAPLSEMKISNGDTLVVTEGHLPPKVCQSVDFSGNSSSFFTSLSPEEQQHQKQVITSERK